MRHTHGINLNLFMIGSSDSLSTSPLVGTQTRDTALSERPAFATDLTKRCSCHSSGAFDP
jgi:hypothetical protein